MTVNLASVYIRRSRDELVVDLSGFRVRPGQKHGTWIPNEGHVEVLGATTAILRQQYRPQHRRGSSQSEFRREISQM